MYDAADRARSRAGPGRAGHTSAQRPPCREQNVVRQSASEERPVLRVSSISQILTSPHLHFPRRRHRETTRAPSRNKTQQANHSNRFDGLSRARTILKNPDEGAKQKRPDCVQNPSNGRCGSVSLSLALFAKRHKHNTGQLRADNNCQACLRSQAIPSARQTRASTLSRN